jgi:hypothetical protein
MHAKEQAKDYIVRVDTAVLDLAMLNEKVCKFYSHYEVPVLGTWVPLPESLLSNPQQVLRWGWTPTLPDSISMAEYEKPHRYWVGRTIPALDEISKFDNGDHEVNNTLLKHWELMKLISEARATFTV